MNEWLFTDLRIRAFWVNVCWIKLDHYSPYVEDGVPHPDEDHAGVAVLNLLLPLVLRLRIAVTLAAEPSLRPDLHV